MKNLIISAFCITTSLVSLSGFALEHPDLRAATLGEGTHPPASASTRLGLAPEAGNAMRFSAVDYNLSNTAPAGWTPGVNYDGSYTVPAGWTPGTVYTDYNENTYSGTGLDGEMYMYSDVEPASMPGWMQ